MTASLSSWLDRIGAEHPKDVLGGLERVADVAARAGVNPPASRNVIVAGTNGKGSTCVFLERLLMADGVTVGTTLSPHVHRFNERIRVNGEEVDDDEIVAAFEAIESARGSTKLTYFEYAVLAAMRVFRARGVEACVLEVGLGGRLDAVNIVDADVAVITSIGIDHTDYLGDTIESIGYEKAGIMRKHVPLVFGEASMPDSIRRRVEECESPLYQLGSAFRPQGSEEGWQVELTTASGERHAVASAAAPSIALANAATAAQAAAL